MLKSCFLNFARILFFIAVTYFRKTGLERSEGLAKDVEWFGQQDIVIPEPSTAGVSYAKYLEELAEKSVPLFLCHFYNIYFSHIAGGQVISRQVCVNRIHTHDLRKNDLIQFLHSSLKTLRIPC